ncbi:MAG: NAD(P)/FAD-dependent oxidoreductase [Candidatus Bathyarchaeota archaeon]|nr:NAD(P)/FAD-dependent oxidoreductase [Candidatus Bathyarchaeota archaeon]
MTKKSLLIIGAGLAGLATGCYGQMNGYKTKIFEMQNKPGGVCISWKRKAYTFDYSIHNLFGMIASSEDNKVWRELGALSGLETYSFKEFVQIEETNGKAFTVYTNLDELESHMIELSPIDKKKISEFVGVCRRFSRYDIFAAMSGGLGAALKMLPVLPSLIKYSKIPVEKFAENFSDPFLQKAFPTIMYDISGVPTLIPMIFLSALSKGDGGWPVGGSLAFSKNIEKRYLELGGELLYNSKVTRILVEDNTAVGVELDDGSKHFGDVIISAADGYSIIFDLLEGKYVNESIKTYYESYPKTISFGFEVWYGVKRDFTGEPHSMVLFQDEPVTFEGRQYNRLDFEIFNFDSTLAPSGKTIVKVVFDSNYDYWNNLSKDREAYVEEKRRIADLLAERLEKRFPGFRSQIEAVDVATPVSVKHWTAAYRGYSVPYPAPESIAKEVSKKGVSKTLPGLKDFHMVGQWAGAFYSTNQVALMGRDLVRQLCKEDNKKFETTFVE